MRLGKRDKLEKKHLDVGRQVVTTRNLAAFKLHQFLRTRVQLLLLQACKARTSQLQKGGWKKE